MVRSLPFQWPYLKPNGPLIIDCHTHLNRYSLSDPPTLRERYARLQGEMDENGVGYALVLSSYVVNDDRPSADELLELVDGNPRLGIVAGVDVPRLGADQIGRLSGLLRSGRIRALKLYPGYQPFFLTDSEVHPVYRLAAEFGVPVMIHTGDTYNPSARIKHAHPLQVDDLAVDFRDVTFIICHLGNPWFTDAMQVIYKNENVFGDISGFTLGEFQPRYERLALGKVNETAAFINDPCKLMFGTDWPISDIGSYVRFAERLEITTEEREGLMWRNAARVFGLGVEGADGRRV